MSDQTHSAVVKISGSFGTDRTNYISRSRIVSGETVKDETATVKSRYIFSNQKNDFLRGAAQTFLEGDIANNSVREIIVASRIFDELGADTLEREFALRGAVRDSMKDLLDSLEHKNAPWVAAIHRNTNNPHIHILVAENYKDKKGDTKSLPPDFPRELFTTNEQGETSISRLFKSNIQKRIIGVPPIEDAAIFAQETIGDDFSSDGGTGKDGFSDLSKKQFIKPEIVERIAGKTLLTDEQGNYVFVKRNLEGRAAGRYTVSKDGKILANENSDVGGDAFFYTGSLQKAEKFVLVDTPMDALALETLATDGRNLERVCFVALEKHNVSPSLINVIKEKITGGENVSVIWSRGNLGTTEQGRAKQKLWGLESLERELNEAAVASQTLPVPIISFNPQPSANSWQRRLYLQETSALNEAARLSVNADTKRSRQFEKYYPTILKTATLPAQEKAHLIPIQNITTLEIEADVLDGTRAYNLKLKKLEATREAAREYAAAKPSEPKIRSNKSVGANQLEAYKRETEEIRNLPLEWVAAANGLHRTRSRGTEIWTDAADTYKIKISGHIYDDYKNRKNEYLPNVIRAGAISLQIHLSGDGQNFKEARAFLKDSLLNSTDTFKLPEINTKINPKLKPVPLALDLDTSKLDAVRGYLEDARGIKSETVEAVIQAGHLAGNSEGNAAVFVLRDLNGHITGDQWRGINVNGERGNALGTYKELGWFYLGNPKAATEIILTEAPIEALSYYDLQPEKDWSQAAIISMNGVSAGESLEIFLTESANLKKICIALNNDVPGQRAAASLAQRLQTERNDLVIENETPAKGSDWNEYLEALQSETLPALRLDFAEERATDITETGDDLLNVLQAAETEQETGEQEQGISIKSFDPELAPAQPVVEVNSADTSEAPIAAESDSDSVISPYADPNYPANIPDDEIEAAASGSFAVRSIFDDDLAESLFADWREKTGKSEISEGAVAEILGIVASGEQKQGFEMTREEFYKIPHLVRQTASNYPDFFLRDRSALQTRFAAPAKYEIFAYGEAKLVDLTNGRAALPVISQALTEQQEEFDNAKTGAKKARQLEKNIERLERLELQSDENWQPLSFALSEARELGLDRAAQNLGFDGILANENAAIWNRAALRSMGEANHALQISKALEIGKFVSEEVLADYPNLAAEVKSSGNQSVNPIQIIVAATPAEQTDEVIRFAPDDQVASTEIVYHEIVTAQNDGENFRGLREAWNAAKAAGKYENLDWRGGYLIGSEKDTNLFAEDVRNQGFNFNLRGVSEQREQIYARTFGAEVWEMSAEDYLAVEQWTEINRYKRAISDNQQGERPSKAERRAQLWQQRIDAGYPFDDLTAKKFNRIYEQQVIKAINKGEVPADRRSELGEINSAFRKAVKSRSALERSRATRLTDEPTAISDPARKEPIKIKKDSALSNTEPFAATAVKTGTQALAEEVRSMLHRGETLGNNIAFNTLAAKHFQGTISAGTFSSKDAYDALELGINGYLKDSAERLVAQDPKVSLRELRELLQKLPTQTNRTDEQIKFQQFSTPPTEAFVAFLAAGATKDDTLLEPSAGTGGLAVFASGNGIPTLVNEIAPRRAALLEMLGFENVTSADAQFLNDTLPPDIRPTVILMNPPFSATGGRTANNRTIYGAEHITDALVRLEEGGRLVAIVGEGMDFGKPTFAGWWTSVLNKYNVRANIAVPGEEYAKYGTSFGNQLLIIDKTGPTSGAGVAEKLEGVVRGNRINLEAILEDVLPLRAERLKNTPTVRENTTIDEQAETKEKEVKENETINNYEQSGESAATMGINFADNFGSQRGDAGASKNATESNRNDPRQFGLFDLFNDGNEPGESTLNAASKQSAISVSSDYAEQGASDLTETAHQVDGNGSESAQSAAAGDNSEQLTDESAQITGEPVKSSIILETNKIRRETVGDGSVRYIPSKLTGGVEHPGDIVESASMAAVVPPDITYTPHLDPNIINEGKLSSLQYEAVVYAGQRHEQILPNGARAGFFIGDGTGVGKGRELAGIALDNWNQGRKRVLWMSINYDLVPSTERDLKDLGAKDVKLSTLDRFAPQANLNETIGDSVLFASYSTLIGKGKDGSSRFDQIVNWLGQDGVIMLDEGHLAKNAVSEVKASQRGEAVVDLQIGEKSNPNWRFVYSSATGATTVQNMGYLQRLGLWGDGTGFPGGFVEFQNKIERGGVGAMEMVARDMKAAGMYVSRSLSYRGVDYAQVHHELTPEQVDIYNTAAAAWAEVAKNIDAALDTTNGDSRARRFAYSRFWSSQQLFFRQLLTAMKVPSLISEVEKNLENGSAYTDSTTGEGRTIPVQIVIGVIGTGEARTKEQIARAAELGLSLDELDFSPKQVLTNLVEKAFPVNRYTEETDPLTGKTRQVILTDADGVPVQSAEAVAMRDALLGELEEKLQLPDNPLDQIIIHFGEGAVAEITGRDKRIIEDPETGQRRYVKRAREGVGMDKASQDEMESFQSGRKRIAIISQSASTGISLHSELKPLLANYVQKGKITPDVADQIQSYWDETKNLGGVIELTKQHDIDVFRRIHLTLENSWSADVLMQTLGRSHRSNQLLPPEYILLSTNLGGEKRFLSTSAKRLSSMGALTRGDRGQAGGGNFLQYDFENQYGESAAKSIVKRLDSGNQELLSQLPPDPRTGEKRYGMDILYTMGIARYNKDGFLEVPNKTIEDLRVTTFLNRMLILDVDTQNALFDLFTQEMERIIRHDKELGLFDEGVTDIKGENIRLAGEAKTVATDKVTGAETKYCQIKADVQTAPVSLDEISERSRTITIGGKSVELNARTGAFYQQIHSKNIIYAEHLSTRTDAATGQLEKLYRFARPAEWQERLLPESELVEKYKPVILNETADFGNKDEPRLAKVKDWWQSEYDKVPPTETRTEHIIAGAVLPVWQRLSTANDKGDAMSLKTVRVETQDGTRIVGVRIPPTQISRVLRDLGVEQSYKTPAEIFKGVLENGERIELVGGLKLGRMFIKRQPVIELQNLSKYQNAEMETLGASKELINFSAKHFIPNDSDLAIPVLTRLLERYPAVDTKDAPNPQIRVETDSDTLPENGAAYSNVAADNSNGVGKNLAERITEVVKTIKERFGKTDEARFAEQEAKTTLERAARRAAVGKQLDTVRDLTWRELLPEASFEVGTKGDFKINAATMEILRQCYNQAYLQGHFSRPASNTGTAMAYPASVGATVLKQMIGGYNQAQEKGYEPEHLEKLENLIKTVADAREDHQHLVFYLDEIDRDHEFLHQAVRLGQTQYDKHQDLSVLIEHPAYLKSVENFIGAAYPDDSDAEKAEETAAFLWGGDEKLIGVEKEDKESYLETFVESFVFTNGYESLKYFEERSNKNVEPTLERIRERINRRTVEQSEHGIGSRQSGNNQIIENDNGNSPGDQRPADRRARFSNQAALGQETQTVEQTGSEAVAKRNQLVDEESQAFALTEKTDGEFQSDERDGGNPRDLPEAVRPNFYTGLRLALEKSHADGNRFRLTQDKQIIWTDAPQQAFLEKTNAARLRMRLYNIAEKKVGNIVEAVARVQDKVDERFHLPFASIRRIYADKQYEREANYAAPVLDKIESGSVSESEQSNMTGRFELLDKKLERLEKGEDSGLIAKPEQQAEILHHVKEFALESRSADGFKATVRLSEMLPENVRHSSYETGRTKAYGKLLRQETCVAKSEELEFALRGKHERFFIMDKEGELLSRKNLTDYSKFFDVSPKDEAERLKKSQEDAGSPRDVQREGWSLVDVQDAHTELRQVASTLSDIAQYQRNKLDKHEDQTKQNIINYFNPLKKIGGEFQLLTDPVGYIEFQLNPLAQLEAHPLVQLVKAWQKHGTLSEQLKVTEDGLETARENLETLDEQIKPQTEAAYNEKCERLTGRQEDAKNFAQDVNTEEREGSEVLRQQGISQPEAVWRDGELQQMGEASVKVGSVEGLEDYAKEEFRLNDTRREIRSAIDKQLADLDVEPNAQLADHLREMSEEPAGVKLQESLKEIGFEDQECEKMTRLDAEMAQANADGELEEWWQAQSSAALERDLPMSENDILRHLAGQQKVLTQQAKEWKNWNAQEFKYKVRKNWNSESWTETTTTEYGNIFKEPLRLETDAGETEFARMQQIIENAGGADEAAENLLPKGLARMQELADIGQGFVGRYEAAEAYLDKTLTDSAAEQTDFEMQFSPENQTKLLTSGEQAIFNDSVAADPLEPFGTDSLETPLLGTSEDLADKLGEIETFDPIETDAIVAGLETEDSSAVLAKSVSELDNHEEEELQQKLQVEKIEAVEAAEVAEAETVAASESAAVMLL